jgi:hypothetical protein
VACGRRPDFERSVIAFAAGSAEEWMVSDRNSDAVLA